MHIFCLDPQNLFSCIPRSSLLLFWKLSSQGLVTFLSYILASSWLLFFYTFLTFLATFLAYFLPTALLLFDILSWKVMNWNDPTVTTVFDWTDSTATSAYEGNKLVTDCKPASDWCRCNDKGSCRHCRCVKLGNICANCLLLQHDHWINNKHIRNTSLTSSTTTMNNESTNVHQNLLANSTPPHANQITQSASQITQ